MAKTIITITMTIIVSMYKLVEVSIFVGVGESVTEDVEVGVTIGDGVGVETCVGVTVGVGVIT